jgi:hypothetical protein
MSLFASTPFDVLKAESLFTRKFSAEEGQPDEFGQVGDAGQPTAPDSKGDCPPCMKLGKAESTDEKGNRIEKDICVPACDTAKGEVCYIHPCVNNQGWTCLSPKPVAGGGSRIVFPSNLTTTCGEQGYTGNNKACPCIVCNNAISISKCQGDCTTCGGVAGATNIGQGLNNQQLCGSSVGNVLVTGAGQGQGVVRTPPSGTQWGFIEDSSGCNCPAGAQKVNDPATGRQKCANVGCTDPKADNYDSNATVACGEGTIWPNRCCTYPPYVPSCDDNNACNRHFTNGANMDCMFLGTNCEPICADSRSVDYAGRRAEASAKSLKQLFYYEESANYDWSATGKPLGDKERWATMTSKLAPTRARTQDSQEREALANQARDLFFKPCVCPDGEAWGLDMCQKLGCNKYGACNHDASAKIDDGSCEYETCKGCMMTGADNYDPTATIPCYNGISGLPNSCCEKDACPDKNSCQYDSFCGGPMSNSSNMTKCNTSACKSCKKGYKLNSAGNGCTKCADDDEAEECFLGCSATENPATNTLTTLTKSVGNAIMGAGNAQVGGFSLLTWGVIGLVVGGIVAASAE